MSFFDNFDGKGKKFGMQDNTVNNPDNSESEIIPLEADEEASSVEKDQVDIASEALAMFQGAKLSTIRKRVVSKHNRLAKMFKALKKDGLTSYMRDILLEEGVIDPGDTKILDDSAAADIKEAAKESTPDEIAEKGATQEELVKDSQLCIKAQCRVLANLYNEIMKV